MNTATKAVWTESNELKYDWPAITAASAAAGLDPDSVKDFVFDAVTDTCTAQEVLDAFISATE